MGLSQCSDTTAFPIYPFLLFKIKGRGHLGRGRFFFFKWELNNRQTILETEFHLRFSMSRRRKSRNDFRLENLVWFEYHLHFGAAFSSAATFISQ